MDNQIKNNNTYYSSNLNIKAMDHSNGNQFQIINFLSVQKAKQKLKIQSDLSVSLIIQSFSRQISLVIQLIQDIEIRNNINELINSQRILINQLKVQEHIQDDKKINTYYQKLKSFNSSAYNLFTNLLPIKSIYLDKNMSLSKALDVFQLTQDTLEIKKIAWIYKAKKAYFLKFSEEKFYIEKYNELQLAKKVLESELEKRRELDMKNQWI